MRPACSSLRIQLVRVEPRPAGLPDAAARTAGADRAVARGHDRLAGVRRRDRAEPRACAARNARGAADMAAIGLEVDVRTGPARRILPRRAPTQTPLRGPAAPILSARKRTGGDDADLAQNSGPGDVSLCRRDARERRRSIRDDGEKENNPALGGARGTTTLVRPIPLTSQNRYRHPLPSPRPHRCRRCR